MEGSLNDEESATISSEKAKIMVKEERKGKNREVTSQEGVMRRNRPFAGETAPTRLHQRVKE